MAFQLWEAFFALKRNIPLSLLVYKDNSIRFKAAPNSLASLIK